MAVTPIGSRSDKRLLLTRVGSWVARQTREGHLGTRSRNAKSSGRLQSLGDAIEIDERLVRELVGSQFPHWRDLRIEKVEPNGWDNRTFRLGSTMSVRLPTHQRYAAQVDKEHRWLPLLAPRLPLAIPTPLARGRPGCGFEWDWSIYEWLPGENAASGRIQDLADFAISLAGFLCALHEVDATDGPGPGRHNFFRGGSLMAYDAETRAAIDALGDRGDQAILEDIWETALDSDWTRHPVWLHGDLVETTLLVSEGRLTAVIDFGVCGVGDPSCDLAITWLLFSGRSRQAFREYLDLDPSTWARARGWTLWKRVKELADDPTHPRANRVVDDLIAEHRAAA